MYHSGWRFSSKKGWITGAALLATAALLVRCEALSYVDSLAAPLSLINALVLAVGQRKRDEVSRVFADMEQVWSRYSIFGKDDE